MALQCPICGAVTAFQPAVSRQNAIDVARSTTDQTFRRDVVAQAIHDHYDESDWYAICRCQDCKRLFVATKWLYSGEWYSIWPLPRGSSVTKGVPTRDVRLAFEKAQKCLALGAYGGCLLMCRTTIIRLLRDRKAATLKELKDKDVISGMLYGQADEVRLWANMVGHDDFDQESVTREAVSELVAYIESLLDATYVQPARLAAMKKARTQAERKKGKPD